MVGAANVGERYGLTVSDATPRCFANPDRTYVLELAESASLNYQSTPYVRCRIGRSTMADSSFVTLRLLNFAQHMPS
jgi:hypothetical protein